MGSTLKEKNLLPLAVVPFGKFYLQTEASKKPVVASVKMSEKQSSVAIDLNFDSKPFSCSLNLSQHLLCPVLIASAYLSAV